MKSIKKLYIIGAVALVLSVVAGLGFVVASGPIKVWGKGFHGPHFHRDLPKHVLSRIDSRVETLNLTEPQKAKYGEIRAKVEKRLREGLEDRKKLREEMRSELNKKTPDMHLVSGMLKKRISGISGFLEENLDLVVEFYDMLDEKQKARIIEHFRDKMG